MEVWQLGLDDVGRVSVPEGVWPTDSPQSYVQSGLLPAMERKRKVRNYIYADNGGYFTLPL